MIDNNNAKEEILDRLVITRRKAQDLQARFTLKNKPDEAKKLKRKCSALTKEIDNLLSQLIQGWLGTADTVTQDIKTKNAVLQTSIRDLKNDLENAEKFVKVIGLIDDVIGIARGLI